MASIGVQVAHTSLWELDQLSHENANVNLVLIPGIGTPSAQGWGMCQPSWFGSQRNSAARLRFLEFRDYIPVDDTFSWQILLDQGERLLQHLNTLQDVSRPSNSPLVLVCHSLGGVALKEALCIADHRHEQHAQLINSISGIVFISTPHRLPESETSGHLGQRCLDLLRASGHAISDKRRIAELKNSSEILHDLAVRFQQISLGAEVLSIYEESETKFIDGSRKILKSRKVLLSDRELVTTNAIRETHIGLPLSHNEICKLHRRQGEPDLHVRSWMHALLGSIASNLGAKATSRHSIISDKSIPTRTSLHQPPESRQTQFQGATTAEGLGTRDLAAIIEAQHGASTFDLGASSFTSVSTIRKAKLPCFSVGSNVRNKDFYGREDVLKQLDQALLPSASSQTVQQHHSSRHATIFGMGGLGKSTIALEFAFTRRVEFDALFLLRADDVEKFEADLANIADMLGLEDEQQPRNETVSRELAEGWLLNPRRILDQRSDPVSHVEASWLIILDNADNLDWLSRYKRIFQCGSWLITSRHPLAKTEFSPHTIQINLLPFDTGAGAELLQILLRLGPATDEAREVVKVLGGLPLAIVQTAGVIRHRYLSLTGFLGWYQDERERGDLLKLSLEPQPTARGTMSSIWAIDDLSSASRSLLEAMVFLDTDNIQYYLLRDQCAESISDPHYPRGLGSFYKSRGDLIDRSLIQENDTLSVRIHRVLQDVLRARMQERLSTAFRDTVAILSTAWPSQGGHKAHSIERWPRCEQLYPHVISLQRRYNQEWLRQDAAKLQYAKLLERAGWWQHERGTSLSIPMLNEAETICESCEQTLEAQNLRSDILYGLGAVAPTINDPESCLKHNRKLLEIRQKIDQGKGKDLRLGIAHNQMGIGYMMSNQVDEGLQSFESALKIYAASPGVEIAHGHATVASANVGLALWIKGDLDLAASTFQKAIADREAEFGPMDMQSFRSGRLWYGLGNIRYSQGDFESSEECHRKALSLFLGTIGNRHHRTADILHRVAQHALRKHDLDKAQQLVNQALRIWATRKDFYQPEIARTTFLKAKILSLEGNHPDSSDLYRQAASARRTIVGVKDEHLIADEDLTEEHFDELVTFWSR